ncbi:MAG: 30S ribosomal protein S12 methylthiotransferase RimO [Acidobacteriota bacterium]
MKTIALISLGCAKNLVDSEVMMGVLKQAGFGFTSRPEDADIILINTCGFIQPARDEADREVERILLLKEQGPKPKKVIVAGCYVQKDRKRLQANYPEVDIWLGVRDFGRIAEAINGSPLPRSRRTFLYSHISPRFVSTSPYWAYVKISEGCSHRCGFCAIPSIKGPYRSRPVSSIQAEVSRLVFLGIKEINLVSQDSTFFGRDRGKRNGLTDLLQTLLERTEAAWIRVLYGYPGEVTEPLLEVMNNPRICPYFDIPFQHSHPAVLKEMKRGLDGERSLRLLDQIRSSVPAAVIRTSLITGFPSEGEKEFRHLLQFVRDARFDHLGVFPYSPEEGTACFSAGDPVPDDIKKERVEAVLSLQQGISADNNRRYLHQKLDVLLEGPTSGLLLGRTRFQAPEVDGITRITTGGKDADFSHPFLPVEITWTDVYDLKGVLLK